MTYKCQFYKSGILQIHQLIICEAQNPIPELAMRPITHVGAYTKLSYQYQQQQFHKQSTLNMPINIICI